MVACAISDLPGAFTAGNRILCVGRPEHMSDGTREDLQSAFANLDFIADPVLAGQAQGCLQAAAHLSSGEEVLIGACDCGIDVDHQALEELRAIADVIVFSHQGDLTLELDPGAHSWLRCEADGKVNELLFKRAPDHHSPATVATTGVFWYKDGAVFHQHLRAVCEGAARGPERYVDEVVQFSLSQGLSVYQLQVEYFGWGTPADFERYEKTVAYWRRFRDAEAWIR
jgi:hypothetical protein